MAEHNPGVDPDLALLMAHPVPAEAPPTPRRRRARVQTGIGQPNDTAPFPGGFDELFEDIFDESNPTEPSPTPAPVETNPNPPAVELPPEPGQPSILKKVQFMVVSAVGAHEKRVTYRDAFGRESSRTVKSKDVYTIEQADFANRRMTESKDKWDPSSIEGLKGYQRWGKKIEVGLARIWKGTLAEDAHRKKEFALGIELSKISGIDIAVSEEFYSVIEQKARARIKDERKTGTQKFFGGVSDAWAEFTATNSKLHKYEIEEARELRRRYDANPANSDPVENPLYALVNRDVATRESLAARMNENSIDILKQTNPGDKKTTVAIRLDGPAGKKVEDYLKKEILSNIIDDFTTRLDAKEDVTGIEPKLRRESDLKLQNYFMTNEFQDWVKTLPADQQALFESSFTYATDLLLQAEEGLLPAVKQSLDHFKSGDKLNFDIELGLGTAQIEANTETYKDGWFSAERKSLNKNLMEKMRGERNTSPESHLYDTDVIHGGMVKDRMMGYVTSIVKSEALWAWASAMTVKGASIAARKYSELAPSVTAGLVAGTLSGLKEWARMDQIRASRGFGVANGLEFPSTADAVKSAELASADYNRIQMSDRTQQLVESITRFKDGTADVNTAFMAMVYDADSTARLMLNAERNINLMTASVDGPQGRGIYMRELRQLDKARAMNSVMIEAFLVDDAKRNELADLIGIPADQPRDARAMMNRLVASQYYNLLSGVKIDGALSAKLSTLDSKLVLAESESIRARDKIYNGMHLKSTAKYAATSGAFAFALSWGLGKVFNHEADILSRGHEDTTLVMADHTMPHITDSVPTATITDDQGNMVVQTFSHVPSGTHLELVHDQLNGVQEINPTYNLVVDNNPDKVLIHSIDFGSHGEIVNMADIQDDLTANHISISPENLHTVGWEVQDISNPLEGHGEFITQTKDLTMDDLPGYNEQGWSGWFHNTMSADGNPPRDPELNAVLKTFRSYEIWEQNDGSNVVNEYPGRVVHFRDLNTDIFDGHKDVVAAPQSGTAVFKGIPHLWSTPEGHEAIARVFDEAEATYKATETFTDEAHRIIYEAGVGGESGVPDADEMKVLLNYDWNMSGAVPEAVPVETTTTIINPVENWFNLEQDVTEVVAIPPENLYTETVADGWTHLVALGYVHPLEGPIGKVGSAENPYMSYIDRERIDTRNNYRMRRYTLDNPDDLNTDLLRGTGSQANNPYGVARSRDEIKGAYSENSSLKENISNAQEVYAVMPYHIGDALVSYQYVNALKAQIQKLNPNANLHLVVSNSVYPLLQGATQPGLIVEKGGQTEPRIDVSGPHAMRTHELKGTEYVLEQIKLSPDKNVVIFDFENLAEGDEEVKEINTNGRSVTYLGKLFGLTFAYGSKQMGNGRYSTFAHDLIGEDLSPSEEGVTGKIILPPNAEAEYQAIAKKYNIDVNKPQISVVLESGSTGRQYSVEKWTNVVKKILQQHPELQVNFIVNTKKKDGDPTKVDEAKLNQLIASLGNSGAKIVDGNLLQLATLFQKQKLILSDDGGLLHIAGAVENGPNVIGVFFPGFSNHWSIDRDKVSGVEAPEGMGSFADEWGVTDESKKWINKIQEDDIARLALEKLA